MCPLYRTTVSKVVLSQQIACFQTPIKICLLDRIEVAVMPYRIHFLAKQTMFKPKYFKTSDDIWFEHILFPKKVATGGTVDSHCNDTVGIRKMYRYIQTINITSINFYN